MIPKENNLSIFNISTSTKHLRKFYGFKLREVSNGTGISISQLCDIEHGKTFPSISTLLALAKFYKKENDINFFLEHP